MPVIMGSGRHHEEFQQNVRGGNEWSISPDVADKIKLILDSEESEVAEKKTEWQWRISQNLTANQESFKSVFLGWGQYRKYWIKFDRRRLGPWML